VVGPDVVAGLGKKYDTAPRGSVRRVSPPCECGLWVSPVEEAKRGARVLARCARGFSELRGAVGDGGNRTYLGENHSAAALIKNIRVLRKPISKLLDLL
jgi:hypothetical protein